MDLYTLFTGIISGLAISIIANILTPGVNNIASNLVGKIFKKINNRNKRRKDIFQSKVNAISSNTHEEAMQGQKIIIDLLWGIVFILFGGIFLIMCVVSKQPDKSLIISSFLFITVGLLYCMSTQNDAVILSEVRRNRRKQPKLIDSQSSFKQSLSASDSESISFSEEDKSHLPIDGNESSYSDDR